ncbi:serine/threonine-protein kinase [Jidongwangia harbinensis]|uniref:serine/threonine-protein kinase n=1 Tax=Jidongwangia harbinensis TaxID=2878561 RepID=UPI001CD996DD|nr:serine/threonine-protein kinase [Jidongwangia harbinensis]MCA2217345.1 serine/threonine protein kinase [Jidongwangia harbinensis]
MHSALHARDPRWLGRYELIARLGQGGMGVVFLGRDPSGRSVAVKIVRNEFSYDQQYRNRFRSEVSRARQVPPFCTAEVLDADPDHDPPYLVVEYVDGPSLAAVVRRRGRLQGAELHGVAVGIATALAAIHGAGVIHRDLKPGNVLFAMGGVKVIDFGIARPLEATSHHTGTDHMVGTVAYMAPERFDTDAVDEVTTAADIFAWGALVGFAATGRTPFAAGSPPATAMRILTQPPDLDGVPESLRDIVGRALDKDPRRRPTARELVDLLVPDGRAASAVVPVDTSGADPERGDTQDTPALPVSAGIALTGETAATVARRRGRRRAHRRVRAERRWAWPAAAGVALATVSLTAAIGLPWVFGGTDGSAADPGAGQDRATGTAGQAATMFVEPSEPFTFTFSGYRVGRYRVQDPAVVSTAYEIARVNDDRDLYAYLTLFRTGVFDPESVAGVQRTTVGGRPALERSAVDQAPGLPTSLTSRFLAWEVADKRWATLQAYSAAENDPSPRDLRDIAQWLKPDRARPATLPFTLGYVPVGYQPVQVGTGAWANVAGIRAIDLNNHGGAVFARPLPKPAGLTSPWRTSIDTDLPTRFEVLVSPDRKKAPPYPTECEEGSCYLWRVQDGVRIDVVSQQLSKAEKRRILDGVKLAEVTAPEDWPEAVSAFPVGP